MLTHKPIPPLRNLLAILNPTPAHLPQMARPWHREGERAGWLSRSAWSLALIAIWRKKLKPGTHPPTFWLPGYFCNESLSAIRQTDTRLVFYPVNDRLEPDFAAIDQLIGREGPPDIFMYIHYFGQAGSRLSEAARLCRDHGSWLLEDGAHVLLPEVGIGEMGDFVVYSPHKLLPIPDGGLLVIRPDGPSKFGSKVLDELGNQEQWVADLRPLEQKLKRAGKNPLSPSSTWLIKSFLLGLGFGKPFQKTEFDGDRTITGVQPFTIFKPRLSWIASKLLSPAIKGLSKEPGQRSVNLQAANLRLQNMIRNEFPDSKPIPCPANSRFVPYMAGFTTEPESTSKNGLHNSRQELAVKVLLEAGLPVMTWPGTCGKPDLPPEVIADAESHPIALQERRSRFFLPVHGCIQPGEYEQ